MAPKLPSDFDPQRYLESYPDVALSGLSPNEHFLRFGRLLGRNPAGNPRLPKAGAPAAQVQRGREKPKSAASPPKQQSPIIERPRGFEAGKVVPEPAPPKANCSANGTISIEALAAGPFASPGDGERIRVPLMAYRLMRCVEAAPVPENPCLCGSGRFRAGSARLETAWFADGSMLKLMIAGREEGGSEEAGWVVRAYEGDSNAPAQLRMIGGMRIPTLGPTFFQVRLGNPLMPLVLELSANDGTVLDFALLPFPSLLAGGVHAAELKALQPGFNSMDAFWSLSDVLVRELLGRPGQGRRSIAQLAIRERTATAAMSPEMDQWLHALFDLSFSDERKKVPAGALRLVLPADAIPAIGALVSRRISIPSGGERSGPFLVSEQVTFRPRWSVSLPANAKPEQTLPVLHRGGRKNNSSKANTSVPTHLAIVLRDAGVPILEEQGEGHPPPGGQPKLPALTIVVDASDANRAESLLTRLSPIALKSDCELLVRVGDDDRAVAAVADRICGSGKWKAAGHADLRELARKASHETLLTVNDRVAVTEAAVRKLHDLLHSQERVASASCLLFGETIVKKRVVLQPATGGLFPARVSFAASPRLAFFEPDVRDALSHLDYTVVANTLLFTAWRTAALAALEFPDGAVPEPAVDIRIGLDLLEAGYQSLCSSRFGVTMSGAYSRRDIIDPMGSAYVEPGRWEDVLTRVSLLRELN